MTVDELRDVIEPHFKNLNRRLDRIESRLDRADAEINSLKVRDAYWAGGLAAAWAILAWLWKN